MITVELVSDVRAHPNADRLELIKVLGYQVVVRKGVFRVGSKVIFFKPDTLIPDAESLGVENYLKHAVFNGKKTKCRVGAIKVRGEESFGLALPTDRKVGTNLTDFYKAEHYQPPVKIRAGDARAEHPRFPVYTKIKSLRNHPGAIPEGTMVRITEKIHGTNSRVGLIDGEFHCGSHYCNKKGGLYWGPLADVEGLLRYLGEAVIYGEIFGRKIQDLDYGAYVDYRVFDVLKDGKYMDYEDLLFCTKKFEVPMVPVLYTGPYCEDVLKYAYGPTTFKGVASKFKGREGCVITPLKECYSEVLRGRMIVKVISGDYYDR